MLSTAHVGNGCQLPDCKTIPMQGVCGVCTIVDEIAIFFQF